MFCSKCGQEIQSGWNFCSHCGTKAPAPADVAAVDVPASPTKLAEAETPIADPQPVKSGQKILILAGAGFLLLIVLTSLSSCPRKVTDASEFNESVGTANSTTNSTANGSEAATPAPEPENWSYSTDEDKVRGATTYYAQTTSTNGVYQGPPYDPDTKMKLMIRKAPAYGTDVILTITSGQMMCPSYEGCSGTVRFDDGPAQRVSFNGPADNSSEVVFVIGAKSFITKLKKAKKVIIEKTLYQAGNPQFEFDVAGLKWDH